MTINSKTQAIEQVISDIFEQAVKNVVNHIQLFWAKSMKEGLITYFQNDGKLLNEISKQAAAQLVIFNQPTQIN